LPVELGLLDFHILYLSLLKNIWARSKNKRRKGLKKAKNSPYKGFKYEEIKITGVEFVHFV